MVGRVRNWRCSRESGSASPPSGVPTSSRCSGRPASASRASRSSSWSTWDRRTAAYSAGGQCRTAVEPVQRLRPAREAGRARLRQRRAARGRGEARRGGRGARRPRRRRRARRAPRTAHRPRRKRRRGRSRDAVLLRAHPRRVARRREGRRCSCSRTSTGPTRACSTSSRRSPRAFATCRCCSWRSPGRSCSTSGPGWAGGLPAYTALRSTGSPATTRGSSRTPARRARSARDPAHTIAETAEGNPLFIEELAASLAERSTAERRAADEHPGDRRRAARRAAPDERSVLVDASVVGRVFWRGALSRISPRETLGPARIARGARLVRREAVSRIRGDQQFAFKHA